MNRHGVPGASFLIGFTGQQFGITVENLFWMTTAKLFHSLTTVLLINLYQTALMCDFSNSSLWFGYPHINEE